MKVAAIQTVSGSSLVDANLLAKPCRLLKSGCGSAGAELAVLPEYFCLHGRDRRHRQTARSQERRAWAKAHPAIFVRHGANDLNIWIVGGTLAHFQRRANRHGRNRSHARVFNASLAYNPRKETAPARYDKIHLFRFDNGRERYDESRALLRAGNTPVTVFELPSTATGTDWTHRP